ncbi:hypothetical protein AGMMS49991_08260 [Spirochaetia bacterium]|nr:hypothetical protein AGMMS49991_08260 [Spirochaetia bacterium]
MKKNSNSRDFDPSRYESYDLCDTRYYGVFLKGPRDDQRTFIDPKRWQKLFNLPKAVKTVMDKRKGPLFQPARKMKQDYNVNCMLNDLAEIRRDWEETNKPIINRVLSEISGKLFIPGVDDLYQSGIIDFTEAATRATMKNWISSSVAETMKNKLFNSLRAQFFHQMVSQVEALLIKTLTKNGYEKDKFDRTVFYTFKGAKEENIRELDGFAEYDKMYAIWHFIKHNSLSTFTCLKTKFPDTLKKSDYIQGEIACFYVDFNDTLIDTIFSGVEKFITGYCHIVFGEDAEEAAWNSEEFFKDIVFREIRELEDPFGIDNLF